MIAALAGIAAFVLLITWQVQSDGWLVTFDGQFNAALLGLRSRLALQAGAWISQIGTGAAGAILCVVAGGLFWSDGRTRLIIPLWVTFLGAQATTWSMKFISDRARPHFLEGITAASPSFPSAHATVSMAVYLFLALAIAQGVPHGRWSVFVLASLLILCICFSRMLLSLHYFSDVLAGASVGLFWALIGWRLAAA